MRFKNMAQSSSYSNNSDNTEAELRKMVVTFRVHELQHLLGFANKNKNGKKNELLARALELVRTTRSVAVQQKVRELFRRRFPEQRYQSDHMIGGDSVYLSGGSSCISPPPYASSSTSSSSSSSSAANAFFNMANCFKNDSNMIIDSHPDVKFINLPFYDLMTVLVRPTLLRCLSAQKFQENYIAFTLTAQQLQDISYPDSAPLPRYEVQLRFCVMDLTSEQKDDFPSGIEVRMNDKLVQLPNPIPTNKPGVEPKRPSRPVNITPYCKASQPQRVYIHWAADPNKNYVVGVYLVRRVTSSILLQRLKQKGLNPSQRSKQMIKTNLASDNEIATTSLRVSLQCPLGKMRMQIPCRLRQCKHLQCFDADLFLRMNEKKPTWVCPVCDRPTPFEDLTIDGYFTEVLLNACKDVSEIELFESGEWVPVDKDDSSANDSDSSSRCDSLRNSGAANDVHLENNILASDYPLDPKTACRLTSPSASCSPAAGSRFSQTTLKSPTTASSTAEVVIDLTESDDEDAATSTTTVSGRSPAVSNSVAARHGTSLSQSCSTSPSGSIIVLDSPPSRQTTAAGTPDDPLENFLRASTHIISATSPSSGSTNSAHTNFSPPKKRFKPLSPLVSIPTGGGSPLAAPLYTGTSTTTNGGSSGLSMPSPIDYTSYNSLYRRQHGNYSNFSSYVPSAVAAAGSPLMAPSSPYGANGSMSSDMPHSAPLTQSSSMNGGGGGATAFFPPMSTQQQAQQPPPPLHFGPLFPAAAAATSSYFSMLYGGGSPQTSQMSLAHNNSSSNIFNVDNRPTIGGGLNVNDYLPFLDSNMEEYQRFLKACMPDANGLS